MLTALSSLRQLKASRNGKCTVLALIFSSHPKFNKAMLNGTQMVVAVKKGPLEL